MSSAHTAHRNDARTAASVAHAPARTLFLASLVATDGWEWRVRTDCIDTFVRCTPRLTRSSEPNLTTRSSFMAQDVFKIFKDLEMKAVGLDPNSNQLQEGYFSAF